MDVAIVGAGCRLPGGADTPDQLWALLRDGRDVVTEVPPDRYDVDAVLDPEGRAPGTLYTRSGGFLPAIDGFDADFFGISPREARHLDPQQRLLLEVTWEALEDGGQPPDGLAGSDTGVFVGASTHDYADLQALPSMRSRLDAYVGTGGAMSILANRVSYTLDLRGPSLVVDTACSSSLTAVHLACRDLAEGRSTLAVVGGVNAILTPAATIMFGKASMLSPGGRCKPFDASADGYVRSEGAVALVLKPLAAAVADRDPVYAVIRSTAVNQDGRTPGISVPSAEAQRQLLRRALADAGLAATDVQYVEAHGTGTPVGDPQEAAAIGGVYGAGRTAGRACLIGSVKSNLGHLEAAAGITGLLKTALALRHREIPPSLHFTRPNPRIDLDGLGLRVVTRTQPWPAAPGRAFAGVNAFGFGGSNAHAVVAEGPPRPAPSAAGTAPRILALSARSGPALRVLADSWITRLEDADGASLRDLCYTAAVRRSHHPHRLAVVADSREAMAAALRAHLAGEPHPAVVSGHASGGRPKVAFVLSGMGGQTRGAGAALLREEPAFREAIDACDAALAPLADWSVRDDLAADDDAASAIPADRAHVANMALQVGLAALLGSWGVRPDAIAGHSSGETGAACLAGALELPDAVALAFHRGRLLQATAGTGAMLAAAIPRDRAHELVTGREELVCVAAHNGPESVTFSGDTHALAEIRALLQADGRWCRQLAVDIPYHSPRLDGLEGPLLTSLAGLRPRPPAVPLVSTTTGDWVDGACLDAAHWWQNIRRPVRFADAVDRLAESGSDVFVELGAHPALAASLQGCLSARGRAGSLVSTLRRGEDERQALLRAVALLYARGCSPDWACVQDRDGTCVAVPRYPWQRERHWIDPAPDEGRGRTTGAALPGRRLRAALPTWESDLGHPALAYLDEHVVGGRPTFPGAGHVVLALAAAATARHGGPVVLHDLTFDSLLTLEDRSGSLLQCVLDPVQGTVSVHSGRTSEDVWHRRSAARLGDPVTVPSRIDLAELRQRCGTALPVHRFYWEAENYLGLTYRGPFRSITELRLGAGEALARVTGDPFPTDDGLPVHPALLDAAFQALLAAQRSRADGGLQPGDTVLPIGITRVECHGRIGGTFWSHARVDDGGNDDLQGTVSLVDDTGAAILTCRGLRLRVLRRPRPAIGDCLLEEVWEPLPERPGPRLAAGTATRVARQIGPRLEKLAADTGFARQYDRITPALDRLAATLLLDALAALGWDGDPDPDAARLARRLGVVDRHVRQFEQLVALHRALPAAVAAGSVRETGDALQDPAVRPGVELVRASGERLAETLRGREDPRRWLIAGDSAAALADFYARTPSGRFYNAVLAEALAAARPPGQDLRILEVGAGTGATTEAVLHGLAGRIDDYLVTDVSPYFVRQLRDRFGGSPGLRFAVLDAERLPDATHPPFDVIVAADVVHATTDVRSTLANLRSALVPGGLAVLLEPVRQALWLQLVFGQVAGWWSSTDTELRPSGPLLGLEQWQALLREAGFSDVAAVTDAPSDGGEPMQAVLIAQAAPAPAAPPAADDAPRGRWLVLADGGDVARRVVAGLRRSGERCLVARPGAGYRRSDADCVELDPRSEDDWARILHGLRDDDRAAPRVLHLWGLDTPTDPTADAAAMLAAQEYACGGVVTLLRAAHRERLPLDAITFVTAAAQSAPGDTGGISVAQTPLWGLARVVRNEHAARRCLTIDLGGPRTDAAIDDLLEELVRPGPGQPPELLLRDGARHRRRLRPPVLTASERQRRRRAAPDTVPMRLEVVRPGALDSLRLVATEPVERRPGEVEIRVRAAALNFRDVMLALGLLGDGRRRRPLGFDCAGVVLAADAATGLHPGEEVVALGLGTLGSRAVTDAALVAAKPPGLDFARAAALPAAFVTAQVALGELAAVSAGERVLVHTASGGVGLAAVQLCQRAGAEVLATAGTEEKRAFLRALGVAHVMDSRSLDFAEEVLAVTGGEGVEVVLNSLVGEARDRSLALVRPSGRFVDMAVRDMLEDKRLPMRPFADGLSYHAVGTAAESLPVGWGVHLRGLVADVGSGRLEPLPTTVYELGDAASAFRFMAQARHIGKVVCTVDEPHYWVEHAPPPLFRPDGTYLLVGGLGGLGLATARWMVRRGARHLVLSSRSGRPQPEEQAALDALARSGARVTTVRADAVDRAAMQRVLDSIRAGMPPLRGVVHAAMVLDDDLLGRLDYDRFRAVLAPKIAGAWNLHQLTLDDDLELFLLYSSVSSLMGAPAQSSYAAANSFLDGVAVHRRGLGLPALTVNWGAVGGVGYVSRHPEVLARFPRAERTAVRMMSTDVAFAALERAIGNDVGRVAIGHGDWAAWFPDTAEPSVGVPGGTLAVHRDEEPNGHVPLAGDGQGSSPRGGDRDGMEALQWLVKRTASVFDTRPDRIDPDRPLTEMGMDSLMAVELQTVISNDFGTEVALVDLLEGATLRQLAEAVDGSSAIAGPTGGPATAAPRQQA